MEKKRMRSSYFYCFGEIEYSSSRPSSAVKTRSSILMVRRSSREVAVEWRVECFAVVELEC
ncbi:predicted protein [Arabidopsis lyrata subsp. lyrata]|uniref:Predicted protein n=1 Tax=Arabidopsis lyrata subsp. lyrata TaxID=81972 RepID=D7KQZ1_ARALL|nr:predicted protein [Arabidopsis lyrata subsp. lyrata]